MTARKRTLPWMAGRSRLSMAVRTYRPTPGHEKIVSVRIAPVRYDPKSSPMAVMIGSRALPSAWRDDHPGFAQPLGARGAHRVALQRFEHRGAGDPGLERDRAHPQGARRQDQEREAAEAGRRKPLQRDGKAENQQQADPVDRERDAEVAAEGGNAVGPRAGVDRPDDAGEQPERDGQQHRRGGQFERGREALQQFPSDRAVGDVAAAEVTVRDVGDVAPEPPVERVVEVQFAAHPHHRGAVGALADDGADRIAGGEVEQHEGEREHAEERRHQQGEAQRHVADHGVSVTPVQRWPLKIRG